jgi:alkanesulfonate monooxygenase SsuD/methylene tetrahydromethanopterin reductase-like flavin-dependent oxidoreductase (luciferase family)
MTPLGFVFHSFPTSYRELREAALRLESLGFESVWTWDHYVSWNDPREPVVEGLTTLAGLAEATSRVRVGVLVANNTNRHPGRLAKIAATLQEIAGGRFELGLGAGGYAAEQTSFGIDEPPAAERVARVAEALQIIRALWRGGPVGFEGQFYQLRDAYCAPASDPSPRLIVGASGPRMARIAGRYADGLNLQLRDHARFPELLDACAEGRGQAGRSRESFDLSLHAPWDAGWQQDGRGALARAAALGFDRVLLHAPAPVPLAGLARLAEELGLG